MKRNMKITWKIFLIVMIPIIGILGYWTAIHWNDDVRASRAEKIIKSDASSYGTEEGKDYSNYTSEDTKHKYPYVKTSEDEAILYDTDDSEICRYSYIYENDVDQRGNIFRYIENGYIGYSSFDGEKITSAKYTDASKMKNGTACVTENGEIYYIDEQGKRITKKHYLDAKPFESQGNFARVLMEDGKWAVIDRNENLLLSGFDSINQLPEVTDSGTGVKDGKAVTFACDLSNDEIQIEKVYDDFAEISYSDWAIVKVKTADGKYGAVNQWKNEVIVPAVYDEVEWMMTFDDQDTGVERYTFTCKKSDGTYDLINWSDRNN